MKFDFEQKTLLKILENVNKAIDPTNVFLPLRCFMFDVQEDCIVIKGSNGNFSIKIKQNVNANILKIKQIGSFIIQSSLLLNIIKKCSNIIEFEVIDNHLKIKNNDDEFKINLVEINDYPQIDFELYGNKININATKLREAIKNVIFAASQKEEDIILNGVNLKLENNVLIITATNSYRLAQERIQIQDDRNISFDITIHNKNIKDFIPLEIVDEVSIYVNDYKINLVYENIVIQSKIIDVPYKDVSRILNQNFSKKLTIDKNTLLNAISKATVVAGDSYNRINFDINENQITISSINQELGQTTVVIANDKYHYEGEMIFIVLNSKYLKDAISVFENEIELNFKSSNEMILISSNSKRNNIQIIAPIKSN